MDIINYYMILLVIFAAILHAVWNGMVKSYKDKVISVSAIVFGHVPIAIVVMFAISFGAAEFLKTSGYSTLEMTSSSSVRLD